ncbi:MAG: hypothetical protein ACLP6G_09160 [Terriglobales bacterium]
MRHKWSGLVALLAAAALLPSCGSGQQLLSINITPAAVVFGSTDPRLFAQLTATGVYGHPPATKDLTSQVAWASSLTLVAQVTNTGKVSPSTDCGVSTVMASFTTNDPTGNVVTGTMSVTVDGPSIQNCPTTVPTP